MLFFLIRLIRNLFWPSRSARSLLTIKNALRHLDFNDLAKLRFSVRYEYFSKLADETQK